MVHSRVGVTSASRCTGDTLDSVGLWNPNASNGGARNQTAVAVTSMNGAPKSPTGR